MNLAYSQNGFLVHSRLERSNTGKSSRIRKWQQTAFQEKKLFKNQTLGFPKAQRSEVNGHRNSERFLCQDLLRYYCVPGYKQLLIFIRVTIRHKKSDLMPWPEQRVGVE